jgi:hypothetical protein
VFPGVVPFVERNEEVRLGHRRPFDLDMVLSLGLLVSEQKIESALVSLAIDEIVSVTEVRLDALDSCLLHLLPARRVAANAASRVIGRCTCALASGDGLPAPTLAQKGSGERFAPLAFFSVSAQVVDG